MDLSQRQLFGSDKKHNAPSLTIDLSRYGQIIHVCFSPFEWSQNIILIGFTNKIIVGRCNFEESCDLDIIYEFEHSTRCNVLAISPITILNVLPNVLLFCSAGNDYKMRIIHHSSEQETTCKILQGHSSYINDISFDPENNFLVSVSDDHTAKLWETSEFTCVGTLLLTSAGVSTCWQKDDNSKLLVAEKIGVIRFYNVNTQIPILSLDYGKSLSSAHWAPTNSLVVGSLQLGELLIWDLTRPSVPTHAKLLYSENGGHIKFGPYSELVATVNHLESSLIVTHIHNTTTQKLYAMVSLPSNLTWHYRLPLICLGDDNKLCFWKIVPN